MHQDSVLLATFFVALAAAFLGGILARMVRLPPVVGYLLGGLAVGPFTPGFIGDSHAMSQLAEVGVMFMMFGTGLHFSFDDLMAVRGVAVPGALLQTALGTAVLAAWLFDLSFALGAFLAGVVVGGSKISHRVAAEAIPFQDLFSIIFFASVGMMVNPGLLIEHVGELALLLGLIVAGKWAINMLLGMMFRAGLESSLTIAAGLSQIGEFSFLIGQTGMALGVLSQGQYSLILGAAVLSIGLNTWMFKARTPLKRVLGGVPAIRRLYGGSMAFEVKRVGSPMTDASTPAAVMDASGCLDAGMEAARPDAAGADECLGCAAADALSDLFSAVPDTNLRWMTVPANGVAAGSTLADLQLRAKTGAQAVALRRDDEIESAIEADMLLCAGDIFGLAGTEAQIEVTLALLGNGRG